MQDVCFICGIKQDDFDRETDADYTFDYHTLVPYKSNPINILKVDHWEWNYIWFIAFLKHKDDTEYNGIE